jgi:KDO2-lipid IV(A) lauroyltransferase
MLQNLTRHAADIIFLFRDYKKLPQDTAEFPFQGHATTYALAEGSAPILQKMRQGGIFLTAHYGNYEAIGPWLCRLGIPLKASYIPLKPAWLNHIVENRMRAVDGKSYAVNAKTPREFLRLLDEHKLFCLLSDQDSRIPSAEKGTFLGQIVNVNPLPDFLHRHRPDAPLYICWMEEQPGRKILHAEEILVAPDEKVMDTFNRWLEKRIEENSALWYGWTHRRFYSCKPTTY